MPVAQCACGSELDLADEALGQTVACPLCNEKFRAVAGGAGAELFTSRLTVLGGPDRVGEHFLLGGDGSIGIGKLATNPIRLETPRVSRNHCQLSRTPVGGWRIDDRNSTNGLFLNGQRISSSELSDGDVIRVGEYAFRFTGPVDAIESLEEVTPAEAAQHAPVSKGFVGVPAPAPARFAPAGGVRGSSAHTPAKPASGGEFESAGELDAGLPWDPAVESDPSLELEELIEENDAPDDLYDFAEPVSSPAPRDRPAPPRAEPSLTIAAKGIGPMCPSCQKRLAVNAKICVECGIDVKTGRSLITSKEMDENALAIRADTWIRLISWVIPFGLFPIASEAFATKKPHVTWAIAAITVLTSAAFLVYLAGNSHPDAQAMNLMHWYGSRDVAEKESDKLRALLETSYKREAASEAPDGKLTADAERRAIREAREEAAEISGAPEGVGFHWYQLVTHAFLHGGIMHLAGNLVFLLVFGIRVNEIIGTIRMAVIYPLLAIGSAGIDGLVHMNDRLTAGLGASGAIMGLAGMYIVFFPVQRVHMAIWLRGGMLTRWRVFYKLFTMRGFWLLALWIGFNDLLPMFLKSHDHVGHWAHLGGFAVGVTAAIALLLSRQVNAHGGDLLSVALGKHAWALLGKPAAHVA